MRELGACVVLLCALSILESCRRQTSYPGIPKFDTSGAWGGSSSGLLFVKVDEQGNALLAHVPETNDWQPRDRDPSPTILMPTIVYYDQDSRVIRNVSTSSWIACKGPIWTSLAFPKALKVQDKWNFGVPGPSSNCTLRFEGNAIQAAGRAVLHCMFSPSGKLISVLSSDGFSRGDFMFSGATVSGNRYHEVFCAETGRRVGTPVILKDPNRDDDMIRPTWSPDSRFVVYADGTLAVWVVPVESVNCK